MSLYPREVLEYLALAGIPRGPHSKLYVVDAVHGSDSNPGNRWTKPLATVAAAEDLCVSGHHDTVLLVAGTSPVNEAAAITWDKHLTHLVGLGAPTPVAQRTRIVCNAADLSPFLTISAYGCMFRNLYIWQGQDDVHSLINVRVSGNRNVFQNVHFAGGGHATQAIDGGASLQISGGSENLFEDCTLGVDTVAAATGMACLVYAASGGAARNLFRKCRFTLYAGNAGAIFIELLGNSGLDRWHLFEECVFINLASQAMTQAIAVAAGFDAANKRLLLKDCALIGAGEWDNGNSGLVYLSNGAITAGGNSGIWQATNTT